MSRTELPAPAAWGEGWWVYNGDCIEILRAIPDASVDAVVTDPPYGLAFMNKAWDAHPSAGAFQEWCQEWAAECLRVLKPGGHLLAFGGTRMYHRLASAVEDAGFEIRDSIMWLYGSGFPKSMDVGKAIDKAAGAEREVVLPRTAGRAGSSVPDQSQGRNYRHGEDRSITAPATTDAKQWDGWGTALKPAHEPIVVARKPFKGTVAGNVLEHGTGALNIDGARVGTGTGEERTVQYPDIRGNNYGQDREAYAERGTVTRQVVNKGRWPTNVVLTHTPECVEVSPGVVEAAYSDPDPRSNTEDWRFTSGTVSYQDTPAVYECAPGCPVAELDRQSGTRRSGSRKAGSDYATMGYGGAEGWDMPAIEGSVGGASRFFPVFKYQAKAPSRERPKLEVDGKRIAHPTVKPLELMRWLVRLVTPPGGKVVDPFAGSGTTLQAAVLEGFKAVGIEREDDYVALVRERMGGGEADGIAV